MNIEIIKSLKERAKEMIEDNYARKIGDEEIYSIICELENLQKDIENWKKYCDLEFKIEKQSKEIEELKRNISNDYISKDKIKAKIEEVKDGTFDAKIVLQSLLRKEFPVTITKEELEKRWKE